jgi:hypothetical protein
MPSCKRLPYDPLFNLSATDYSFPRKGLQILPGTTFLMFGQRFSATGAEKRNRMYNRLATLLTITHVATLCRPEGKFGSALRAKRLPGITHRVTGQTDRDIPNSDLYHQDTRMIECRCRLFHGFEGISHLALDHALQGMRDRLHKASSPITDRLCRHPLSIF